jgi:hypothetical protein
MNNAIKPTIEIKTFSSMPELAVEGWDPNGCGGDDYETDRATRLYEALGVSRDDEEYALARHRDGRWALIGLTVSGHRYAEETL